MKKKFHNIEIIITVIKADKSLIKVLKSLSKQRYLPKKIIIVSFNNLKKPNYKNLNIQIVKSPKKNQVFQRTLGLKYLSRNCEILLQLDDRVVLKNNSLKNLNTCWNNSDNSIVGIGLNPANAVMKDSGFVNDLFDKLGFSGRILNNGMNIRYSNLKKDKEVMWLKGGLSSWKVKKIPHIYKRKFPMWDWSVGEDVEFSLSIKKNQKLIVCSNSKATILQRRTKIDNAISQKRGYFYSLSAKRISRKINSNKTLFNFASMISIFMSLLFNFITLNSTKIFYNIGRLKGLFINK